MVSTPDFESGDVGSNPSRSCSFAIFIDSCFSHNQKICNILLFADRHLITDNMIYSGKTFGLILFSSIIVLNRAGLINPFHLVMGKNSRKVVHDSSSSQSVELVQFSSRQFRSNKWRNIKSAAGEGSSCEIEVINNLDEPVLFCWINNKGELKHYRPIMDRSIKDRSVTNNHLEYTQVGHSFVCIKQVHCLPQSIHEVTKESFVFCCTLKSQGKKTVLTLEKQEKPKRNLVAYLRGSLPETNGIQVNSNITGATSKDDLIDTTGKVYHDRVIHGFKVKYEPDVFEATPQLEEIFSLDLSKVVELFPAAACAKLQECTTFWVNKSLTYGTVGKPIHSTTCCFHPLGGADWLENNGLSVEKEGGVEISCAAEYLKSRHYWGDGGLIVHELNHAYHNKFCPDGFDCDEIREVCSCKLFGTC